MKKLLFCASFIIVSINGMEYQLMIKEKYPSLYALVESDIREQKKHAEKLIGLFKTLNTYQLDKDEDFKKNPYLNPDIQQKIKVTSNSFDIQKETISSSEEHKIIVLSEEEDNQRIKKTQKFPCKRKFHEFNRKKNSVDSDFSDDSDEDYLPDSDSSEEEFHFIDDEDEFIEDNEVIEIKQPQGNTAIFHCNISIDGIQCRYNTTQQKYLKPHKIAIHKKGYFCSFCRLDCLSAGGRTHHQELCTKMHKAQKRLKTQQTSKILCNICKIFLKDSEALRRHVKRSHSTATLCNTEVEGIKCTYASGDNYLMMRHKSTDHYTCECSKCKTIFASPGARYQHRKNCSK